MTTDEYIAELKRKSDLKMEEMERKNKKNILHGGCYFFLYLLSQNHVEELHGRE